MNFFRKILSLTLMLGTCLSVEACDLWIGLDENKELSVFSSGDPDECGVGGLDDKEYITSTCKEAIQIDSSNKNLDSDKKLFLKKCKTWIDKYNKSLNIDAAKKCGSN